MSNTHLPVNRKLVAAAGLIAGGLLFAASVRAGTSYQHVLIKALPLGLAFAGFFAPRMRKIAN